ncbi:MAG: hypothetical protein NVSMB55_09760 [Mycobacteriales bacterium]
MGLFDELKDMAGAVEKAASEHPDEVKAALAKLEGVIDEQTGGSHHDQIAQAGAKAQEYIDKNGAPKT